LAVSVKAGGRFEAVMAGNALSDCGIMLERLKNLTVAGHPLHPQLIGIPVGVLPFALVMDGAYHLTGRGRRCVV
jgi:uncharacterized membrane protein